MSTNSSLISRLRAVTAPPTCVPLRCANSGFTLVDPAGAKFTSPPRLHFSVAARIICRKSDIHGRKSPPVDACQPHEVRMRLRSSHSTLGLLTSLACTVAWTEPSDALELAGSITACHDPSRITQIGSTYYLFSTAPNINLRTSTDLVNWSWATRPFSYSSGMPAWMDAVGAGVGDGGGDLWAPDIIQTSSGLLLFYSRNFNNASDITKEHSVCGVAKAGSITGPWTDQGPLMDLTVYSSYYRALDPAPILDQSGQLWVAVGSFGYPNGNGLNNGGIHVYAVSSSTGLLTSANTGGTRIAGSWIEAAYLHYHGGYYYLFFNQSACCLGLKSTYFVRVGRSTTVNGAYSDLDGNSLLTPTSGGTLFMGREYASNYASAGTDTNPIAQANTGAVGREYGPGHVAIATPTDGIDRVTYHYYDANTTNGEPTLGLKTLIWGVDGWPRPGWNLPDGVYAIGTRMNANAGATAAYYLDTASGTPKLATWTGATSQLWDFKRVDLNRYTVSSRALAQSLAITSTDIAGDSKPIGLLAPSAASTAQRWFVEQTNDMSFRFLNVGSGKSMRVAGAAAVAGSGVETMTYGVNLAEQRWFITPAGAFRIQAKLGALYLNAAGTASTSAIDQQAKASSRNQYWWLSPTPDGYTKVTNVQTGLVMTVAGASKANNIAIRQETDAGSDAQRFSFDVLTDGSMRLVPKVSGKTLEVIGGSTTAGALVQQARFTHVKNQQFGLEEVTELAVGGASSVGGATSSGGTTARGGETGSGGTATLGGSTAKGGSTATTLLTSGGTPSSTALGGSSTTVGGSVGQGGAGATNPSGGLGTGVTGGGSAITAAGGEGTTLVLVGGAVGTSTSPAAGSQAIGGGPLGGQFGAITTTTPVGNTADATEDGCGCRIAGHDRSPAARRDWWLLAGLSLMARRRRRGANQTRSSSASSLKKTHSNVA